MASTKLTRTPSSAGNRQKYTISFWVKRSSLGNQFLFNTDGGNEETYLRFKSGDSLQWFEQNSSAATQANRSTNALFRDLNSWYHIVITRDSTQSTATDRLKFYINGVLNTSWAEDATPAQNTNTRWNKGSVEQMIGVGVNGSSNYFDGVMSHIHFCDGYAYAASDFGSTDATTGEWKIKTSPSVSYGTNGFFILKDGNGVTDQSPNSNNWTISGTLTKTEDNPSNVFATLNPLMAFESSANITYDYTNGNTSRRTHDVERFGGASTLGMTLGKFYAEAKLTQKESPTESCIGVSNNVSEEARNNYAVSVSNGGVGYLSNGNKKVAGSDTSYGNTYTVGDIIGIAIDLDNNKLYFSKNGTWQNSGDPTSGSTGTGAISLDPASNNDGAYFFGWGDVSSSSSTTCTVAWNFGNGYIQTTAVSSAGTNASNNGIFEYDVPAGYTALSTKGLNL